MLPYHTESSGLLMCCTPSGSALKGTALVGFGTVERHAVLISVSAMQGKAQHTAMCSEQGMPKHTM